MAGINYTAWFGSCMQFIRSKEMESEFRDYCGGWPSPDVPAPPATQWETIETAPRDGTIFLAASPKGVARCKWDMVDWTEHPMDKASYYWCGVDDEFWVEEPGDEPTHWMPLLPVPQKQ